MLLLWLSRQIEVNSNQVEILIENNQHYTMQEITDILKTSMSIKLLVNMKNVTFILWKKLYRLFDHQPNKSQKEAVRYRLFSQVLLVPTHS